MRYHNLDIHIGKQNGEGYPIRAACSALHGESPDVVPLDLAVFEEDLEKIANGETNSALLAAMGEKLYSALFTARSLQRQLDKCVGASEQRDEGVRLRLQIDEEAPEIAALPWEFLYESKIGSANGGCYLGASIHTPLIRYIALPQSIRCMATAFPLRMLVVIPSRSGLDTEAEREILEETTRDFVQQGALKVTWLDGNVTREQLSNAMLEEHYHIFHFIGHGDFKDDKPVLKINGVAKSEDAIDRHWLARLFSNHLTMKLVVLNSCKGATLSSAKSFLGMAPQLVEQGIPAVIAMQYSIYDDESLCFANTFYHSLLRSPELGRVDVAVSRARNALWMNFENRRAVGVPVLYMRAPDGVLFHVTAEHFFQNIPFSTAAADTAHAALRTHEYNLKVARDPQLIKEEQAQLTAIKHRLKLRHLSFVTAALVVMMMAWIYPVLTFESLDFRLKPETYLLELASLFASPAPDPSLALVALDWETRDADSLALRDGRLPKALRVKHAEIVGRLSQAGARVIAITFDFPDTSAYDQPLADSIRAAAARGTDVVVSVANRDSTGHVALAKPIREAVQGWGHTCMVLPGNTGISNTVPLLITFPDTTILPLPALALQAFAASEGWSGFEMGAHRKVLRRGSPGEFIEASAVEKVVSSDCGAFTGGDKMATMIHDLTPRAALPVRSYATVLAEEDSLPSWFGGKIVFVGEMLVPRSIRRTFTVVDRYSVQLIAEGFSALQRPRIRRMSTAEDYFLIVLMALLGAWLVTLPVSWQRNGLLGAVIGGYGALALWFYMAHALLPNGLYHLAAFQISYIVVLFIKRRWFR